MSWVDPYAVNGSNLSRDFENLNEGSKIDVREDPLEGIDEQVFHKFHYRPEEQGIFHPVLHQGMKLRNNGGVDIFVDEDNGLRLDPSTQSINAFTNHYKLHLHHMTAWISGSENHYVGEHYLVKAGGKQTIIAGGDVEIIAGGSIKMSAGHFEVNAPSYSVPWMPHRHDDLYAPLSHNHDGTYAPAGSYAPASHNHDDRYELKK